MLRDTSLVEPAEVEAESATSASIARQCVEEAGGNWEKAARLMRERLDQDAALFRELMEPMLDAAIWVCIRKACHKTRNAYQRMPGRDDAGGISSLAKSERMKWMDYPLSGGIKLGDADRAKLADEASFHEALAKNNGSKAELFRAIAKRIDGKRVRDAITEQQLAKLAEKIL